MTLMIETYLDQITKTLFSQKELLFSIVKIQNNAHSNTFALQYQEEIDKLKAFYEEFYSKKNEKLYSETSYAAANTEEDKFNQLKSQVAIIKSELNYLKSKKDFGESPSLKERIETLEQNYSTFKKNQDFCADFQFNDFLTVYNSTMKSTTESIKIHHEDIMKLKALTNYLQQRPASESVLSSIRCLKHEIRQMKLSGNQSVENTNVESHAQPNIANLKESINRLNKMVKEAQNNISQCVKVTDFQKSINEIKDNENQLSADISSLSKYKVEIGEMQSQTKKNSELGHNSNKINSQRNIQNSENDIIRSIHDESTSLNNNIQKMQVQSKKDSQNEMESLNDIKSEIEKIAGFKVTFDEMISRFKSDLDQLRSEIKQMKISIGCIKHEMRKVLVQFEDNVELASRVDTLFDKYRKIKDKLKLENSSPGSPKRGTSSDDDTTQKIREDLQLLRQNFVETFSMQNSSITNQSVQLKAMKKYIDEINIPKIEKSINDRLKVIETKLQIISNLAS